MDFKPFLEILKFSNVMAEQGKVTDRNADVRLIYENYFFFSPEKTQDTK